MQKHAHQQAQVTSTILLKEPSAVFIVPHSALLNLILDYFLTTITANGGTEAQQSAECPSFIGRYVMGKCNWCGAEVERDKLFAHQWEKHRG